MKQLFYHSFVLKMGKEAFKDKSSTGSMLKINGWLARDKDGCLNLFQGIHPHRLGEEWVSSGDYGYIGNKDMMPELSWEDEPVEVEISIRVV